MAGSRSSRGHRGAPLRMLLAALLFVATLPLYSAEPIPSAPRVAAPPSIPPAEMTEILRALSLVADYRRHEADRARLSDVLRRHHGLSPGEDPFAFRSRRLRELLHSEEPEQEVLERALDDLSGAIDELRDYVGEERP